MNAYVILHKMCIFYIIYTQRYFLCKPRLVKEKPLQKWGNIFWKNDVPSPPVELQRLVESMSGHTEAVLVSQHLTKRLSFFFLYFVCVFSLFTNGLLAFPKPSKVTLFLVSNNTRKETMKWGRLSVKEGKDSKAIKEMVSFETSWRTLYSTDTKGSHGLTTITE